MSPAPLAHQIAVVEDDAGLRSAMLRMLSAAGWTVQGFGSGEAFLAAHEALQAAQLDDPRCLVLDLYLPGLSGFDLLGRLEGSACRRRTIVITAHDDPRVRQRAHEAGAFAYLPKPFTGDALVDVARAALEGGLP